MGCVLACGARLSAGCVLASRLDLRGSPSSLRPVAKLEDSRRGDSSHVVCLRWDTFFVSIIFFVPLVVFYHFFLCVHACVSVLFVVCVFIFVWFSWFSWFYWFSVVFCGFPGFLGLLWFSLVVFGFLGVPGFLWFSAFSCFL